MIEQQGERDRPVAGWVLVPVQRPADAAALLKLACGRCEQEREGRHRAPDEAEPRSERAREGGRHRAPDPEDDRPQENRSVHDHDRDEDEDDRAERDEDEQRTTPDRDDDGEDETPPHRDDDAVSRRFRRRGVRRRAGRLGPSRRRRAPAAHDQDASDQKPDADDANDADERPTHDTDRSDGD